LVASDNVTEPSGEHADDTFWRRPADTGTGGAAAYPASPPTAPAPAGPSYPGPPTNPAPTGNWRPPVHIQPPPPRRLPPQDLVGVEAEEHRARTVTITVGLVAGVALLVVICLLCSRVLF
jgi:hypothetical protein